jgi:hypothetical protein
VTVTRRKFFSFFGTGIAMLAKPDLFVPKREIYRPRDGEALFLSEDGNLVNAAGDSYGIPVIPQEVYLMFLAKQHATKIHNRMIDRWGR